MNQTQSHPLLSSPSAQETPLHPQSHLITFSLTPPAFQQKQERITKILDISRITLHYGYLPLIIYLGTFPPFYRRNQPTWFPFETETA